jgi:Pyruvate/2-oxoacid:ferredoxin oxidoreductase delta subunit
MKPFVRDKNCFASQSVCTAIKCCPTKAISYIEVEEPILDKVLECNCNDPNREGKVPVTCTDSGCCDDTACGNDLYSCGGTPYGRIIIDYDKCIECGLCAKECCGSAIDMVDKLPEIKDETPKATKSCCCNGKC